MFDSATGSRLLPALFHFGEFSFSAAARLLNAQFINEIPFLL